LGQGYKFHIQLEPFECIAAFLEEPQEENASTANKAKAKRILVFIFLNIGLPFYLRKNSG
jgi:hypothetical protein